MRKLFTEILVTLTSILLTIFINTRSFSQENEPLFSDTVHFRVNMTYMIQNGSFHPSTDTVDMAGSMNGWKGDILQRMDTTNIYGITYVLPDAAVHSYKFRIRSGDTIPETVDSMSRFIRVWDTTMTVTNYFNNFNPAMFPMTFNCNMYYQIRAGHFSPATDFLDVAGNFNNEGAEKHDVLFPRSEDSIYALTLFFDTAMLAAPDLRFKFRFNGDWETAELQNDSSRTYTLTGSGDSFTCWYDNLDPSVPSLPFVYNVTILDSIVSRNTVTGAYNYEDYNLRPEGRSVYQWYTSDSIGGALSAIDSAWYINYTIDSLLIGKYLVFEVKPVTFDSVAGLPVRAWSPERIVGVGLHEKYQPAAKIYPNPVHDLLSVELFKPAIGIMIFDNTGKMLIKLPVLNEGAIKIDAGGLAPGIYFLRLSARDGSVGIFKFMKSE